MMQLETILPPSPILRGPAVKTWAIGMTTAPRKSPTLRQTLDSLAASGFDKPHVFADGGDVCWVPDSKRTTRRTSKWGAWKNFLHGLTELRGTPADAYLMLQDDVTFTPKTREYLEAYLWPEESPLCAVSLYTGAKYTAQSPGWTRHIVSPRSPWLWGALAFAFTPQLVDAMLDSITFLRWSSPHRVDVAIGLACEEVDAAIWHPTPSLCQHIGETSSIWGQHNRAAGLRKAAQFAGDRL